jgi:integrase/recombinase XerC
VGQAGGDGSSEANASEPADRWEPVLKEYERHLVAERDLAPHTVRAYLADLRSLTSHACAMGALAPGDLTLTILRSWLANLKTRGRARTTLARRATAVRVFTRWLVRTGRTEHDPAALLASPRQQRSLPPTLTCLEVRQLLDAAVAAVEGPVGLRDVAILELLYATGCRVGELVALAVDDVDRERNLVLLYGKGRKERSAPFGLPAALTWETGSRRFHFGHRALPGSPGWADRPAGSPVVGASPTSWHRWRARPRTARPPAHRGHPPARRRRRPA